MAKAKDTEEKDGTVAKAMAGIARAKEEEAKEDGARAKVKVCTNSVVGSTFGATSAEVTMAKDMDSGMKAMAEIGTQSDHWASSALRSLKDTSTWGPCLAPLIMNRVLTSLLRLRAGRHPEGACSDGCASH